MLVVLSPEENTRIKELQDALDKLRVVEDQIVRELRSLIYKIEKK